MKQIIAITGGIGTGKSVVCNALRALGYPVYDCDKEAKKLMDSDSEMKNRIAAKISPSALNPDGSLNRAAIASVVFSNSEMLKTLNSIVHGAVRNHFCQWAKSAQSECIFVETAILYESGFNNLVSAIWEVSAPLEIRIRRIEKRNGLTRDEILSRISSQLQKSDPAHHIIVNDDKKEILPQIFSLLNLR